MKLKSYFLLPLLLVSFLAQAQQFKITGTVTSISDGFPLPGVTVELKSNKLSTLSNHEGKYKIIVSDPQNEVLVFSFMGYLIEEVAVKNLREINIALTEDIEKETESGITSSHAKAHAPAQQFFNSAEGWYRFYMPEQPIYK